MGDRSGIALAILSLSGKTPVSNDLLVSMERATKV